MILDWYVNVQVLSVKVPMWNEFALGRYRNVISRGSNKTWVWVGDGVWIQSTPIKATSSTIWNHFKSAVLIMIEEFRPYILSWIVLLTHLPCCSDRGRWSRTHQARTVSLIFTFYSSHCSLYKDGSLYIMWRQQFKQHKTNDSDLRFLLRFTLYNGHTITTSTDINIVALHDDVALRK